MSVKRRIVPVLVSDNVAPNIPQAKPPSLKGNFQEYAAKVHQPQYLNELMARAEKLGYQKKSQRKQVKEKPKAGPHADFLNDFKEYIKQYAKLKRMGKESLYEYLKKRFDRGLYYNESTHRFRKVK